MGLLFIKTSPVKQYSYENEFSGLFDALHQSFLVYICSRLFEIHGHAEHFDLFHLFTLFLRDFDYTARVQHVLHTTGSRRATERK